MRNFFQSAFLINLKRRPDRLESALRHFGSIGIRPEVFNAIDYKMVPCPSYWTEGGPAWACRESHLCILRRCLNEQIEPVLVLEDDIYLCPNFPERLDTFIKEVPDDWDGLMLGGQHHSNPSLVQPGVVRCRNTQRTHAYVARGRFLRETYLQWSSPEQTVHIDWTFGIVQRKCRVYAPDPFLFGQSQGFSDIRCTMEAARLWQRPTGKETILFLDCDRQTMEALREFCVHTGWDRGDDGVDNGLRKVFEGKLSLKKWIEDLQWEAVSVEGMVLGVWHPQARVDMVRACWTGPVVVVRSLDDYLDFLRGINA